MRIELDRVGVALGRQSVLEDVSLTVEPGEVVAVIGPNGAGKSTLLRAVAGFLRHRGRILFAGRPERPAAIGYLPQQGAVPSELRVVEAVLLGRLRRLGLRLRSADLEAAERVIAELGLGALAGRRLAALSGGQRQLVLLAQALAGEPALLLLDEPTSALDLRHALEILGHLRALARARNLSVLLVLHDLNAAARAADRLVLLAEGGLVAAGPPAEVLEPDRLARCYGVEVALLEGPDGRPLVLPLRPLPPAGRDGPEPRVRANSAKTRSKARSAEGLW